MDPEIARDWLTSEATVVGVLITSLMLIIFGQIPTKSRLEDWVEHWKQERQRADRLEAAAVNQARQFDRLASVIEASTRSNIDMTHSMDRLSEHTERIERGLEMLSERAERIERKLEDRT